jgi:zinc transport system substrate-binding protein
MINKTQTSVIKIGTSILAIIIIGITVLFFLQNSSQEKTSTQDTRPKIATTIFPVYDMTKNIVGSHAEVILLVPSSASPHSYSLTPKQVTSVQQAKVLFAIGHGLDDSMVESVMNIANLPSVVVDQQLQLHTYNEQSEQKNKKQLLNTNKNQTDPHYWLTAPNAKQIAITISNKMQDIDPINAEQYRDNLTVYLNQLDSLEEELQTLSQEIAQPSFIAVHNSWTYFAKQYHLKTVGSYEPIEGREPSINDIQRFQQIIKQHNITTFFTEPQKPISTATKLFENEFGLDVAVLDPVGGGAEDDSFIKLMRRNLHAIKNTK